MQAHDFCPTGQLLKSKKPMNAGAGINLLNLQPGGFCANFSERIRRGDAHLMKLFFYGLADVWQF